MMIHFYYILPCSPAKYSYSPKTALVKELSHNSKLCLLEEIVLLPALCGSVEGDEHYKTFDLAGNAQQAQP